MTESKTKTFNEKYQEEKQKLEDELDFLNEKIEKKRSLAKEKNLYARLREIAIKLGRENHSGSYYYRSHGWELSFDTIGRRINLTLDNSKGYLTVFKATQVKKDDYGIFLYIQGGWEERIPELIEKGSQKRKEQELQKVRDKIKAIKETWLL